MVVDVKQTKYPGIQVFEPEVSFKEETPEHKLWEAAKKINGKTYSGLSCLDCIIGQIAVMYGYSKDNKKNNLVDVPQYVSSVFDVDVEKVRTIYFKVCNSPYRENLGFALNMVAEVLKVENDYQYKT